jgi:pimeloyl-ACP methyl ester carboxylesterase
MTTTANNPLVAVLHDGTRIPVTKVGSGPSLLLPVRTDPYDDATATTMRAWGGDPDLGPTLVDGLADLCTVITADYEGHRLNHPAPATLTASNVAVDLLAIADAAGAELFTSYGYSWLALAALQLAIRTDRLTGLVMGGFPPLDGPYAAMLAVTRAAHDATLEQALHPASPKPEATPGDWDAAGIQADPAQTAQFVTLYENLRTFDELAAVARLTIPRLCFVGELDNIDYGSKWGDTRVVIADAVRAHQDELSAQGWTVKILPGLDHLGAMRGDTVVPLLREWLMTGWSMGAAPSQQKA